VARKKHQPDSAAKTLDEIESRGDQILGWVLEHQKQLLIAAGAILVVAGIWGFTFQMRGQALQESAAALAKVQSAYRVAMGGTPGTLELAEPANPATALAIRTEYIAEYEKVAEAYSGTTAGALALLEAGRLQQELGEDEAAIATYEAALDAVDRKETVAAFLLMRLGAAHEEGARWTRAAESYEAASVTHNYPLRYDALANAARAYANAGDDERALAAFDRIETEAPDFRLPPYLEARRDALRRSRSEG
jgi:tetratricopeptide (TPR) repeat protein